MKFQFESLRHLMPSRLTVRARLYGIVGMFIVMLFIGAWVGLGGMSQGNNDIDQLYEGGVRPLVLSDSLIRDVMNNFVTVGEAAYYLDDPSIVQKKLDEIAQRTAQIEMDMKALQEVKASPEVTAAIQRLVEARAGVRESLQMIREALEDGDEGARDLLYGDYLPTLTIMQNEVEKLITLQESEGKQIYEDSDTRYKRTVKLVVIAMLLGIGIGIFLAIVTIRAIMRALQQSISVADGIAAGRLGQAIQAQGHDELSHLLRALGTMDGRLSEIVGKVRAGADEVSLASREIARGNDDLSQRTQEQASSLEETAASMEEMTSTVKQNADNASHANQLANGAREQAERGGEIANQAVVAMSEINTSSRKISDIVGLIDEIAFQTNLLSLNAAVEAARAGEQGRGFAVVAGEVRNLAQRSAEAAKEIKKLINDSVKKVETGAELVQRTGKTLDEIVESVKKVTDIVGEIAAASHEQSAGIDQVNRAVMQMDEGTQQNAALVEESAAAARALEDQSIRLVEEIAFFRFNDGRSTGVTQHSVSLTTSTPSRAALPKKTVSSTTKLASKPVTASPATNKPAPSSTRASSAPTATKVSAKSDDSVWEEF